MFKKVSIIGLGLIGGSLAAALKQSGKVENVVGIDKDKESLDYAVENGIIDEGSLKIGKNVSDSQVVIIATYVDSIPDVALELSKVISKDTLVSDVGSVKSSVVNKVENIFRDKFEFIGAHPISGTKNSGVKFSNPELFRNKNCFLTPTVNSNQASVGKIEAIWKLAGSTVIKTSPENHDLIFSYVSHLPHIVAYALINSVSDVEDGSDLFNFAGGGLRDFTRIAASSPEMWTSIFVENKNELLKSIAAFRNQIDLIEKALANDDAGGLQKLLEKSKLLKDKI